MTPDEANALQHAYRTKRRRWAWRVGRPYSEDHDRAPPGEIDDWEVGD